jgi:CheY-like chemotaxis protein
MAISSKPRTVLVCDDDAVLRILVRATLDQWGFRILEACDGHRALACVREFKPDLILLDVIMPGRSGSEVLAEVRADPDCALTPVIMLSARVQAADRAAGLAAGANYYLSKPFSPPALAGLVKQMLP